MLSYRVIHLLIQHCLLSKMVYLNVKYVIATRRYDFFYIYAKSHWKYHTFEGYYICSFSKGAVHKVRHAIFGQFLPPFPLSHFVTHPGTPPKVRHTSRTPPIFRRPSTKNP